MRRGGMSIVPDHDVAGTGPSPPGISCSRMRLADGSEWTDSPNGSVKVSVVRLSRNVGQPDGDAKSRLTMQILFPFSRIFGNRVCAPV